MIIKLIGKEILYRRFNFLLMTLAIVAAVALFVAFLTTSEASRRETIRLTRDMGFNLRIIPKATNMDDFWKVGFSEYTMPQEYVFRFTSYKDFSFAHLTATLHKKVSWRNIEVILTGLGAEIEPSGVKKTPMSYIIQSGTIYVGYEVAQYLGLQEGDLVEIFGKSFTIAKTLAESGSNSDMYIYAQLHEIQDILNMKGQISEIQALNCLCLTSHDQDPLVILREQLSEVLPEARIIMNRSIAVARERQRLMLENYFAFIIPFMVLACAIWIAAITMINVRDRQQEIGILRAIGFGSLKIVNLFLGKAILCGILGAVLGFISGSLLSLIYGPTIFKVTAGYITPIYDLLIWSLIAAPLFAALAALIPALIAATQDPALQLRSV
jgi:ABC-type lipoprotein release transport system permease subunit